MSSFDGTEIWYDLYSGDGDSMVVILPGFWRTRRHASITGLAATLTRLGHAVAVVDLRGHGESGGRFGFNLHEYRDAEAVMQDLVSRRGALRFAVLGLSLGGAVAVTLAARTQLDVRSLVLISAVADFQKIRPRLNPLELPRHVAWSQAIRWPRFDWSFLNSPKIAAAAEIEEVTAPTCLIHVVDDWLIHHEHSEELHECHSGESELHLVELPCGYHADRIFTVAPGRVESIMETFLEEHFPARLQG